MRILCTALGFAALLSLAACTQAPKSTGNPAATAPAPSEAPSAAPAASCGGGGKSCG
jgi:hypothetical protein